MLPSCSKCGKPYPLTGTPYQCECGGVYDYLDFPAFRPNDIDPVEHSLWKYRPSFGLEDDYPNITLGEGNTPLVEAKYDSQDVWLKLEYLNPTGSYKDRGSALLTHFLVSRGVKEAVEDSSGNAGASFAAYAARAGIQANIFIPSSASGPKRDQIVAYGAHVNLVPGPRVEATRAVIKEIEKGQTYASHAYMPFGLIGIATIAYEILEQMGYKAPGTVVAPLGHGGLVYGLMHGFKALRKAAVVKTEPFYVGLQAEGCAPVFNSFINHEMTLREPIESDTIAEGVRVSHPIRGEAILRELANGRGNILAINDLHLKSAYEEIARKGFFVEPTSALVWAALPELIDWVPKPVVLILTGSGYKTQF